MSTSADEKKSGEGKFDEKHSGEGRLVPRITITNNSSEIFCIRFSPDGKFLAAGCGDGAIRVFNASNGTLAYNLQGGSNVALPTTAIRFRPVTPSTRTKNVFIAANATGLVQHWHMTSAKCLHSMEDEGNQVYAMDYNDEGSRYFTAGKDTAVRVYDEATKSLIVKMQGGGGSSYRSAPGHSNRVFSCKSFPGDENIVLTGGWDNTVQIWDIRAGMAVRSFYGPHICGDALDVVGSEVLTGSWRADHQLEIWDFGTGEKIRDIPFSYASQSFGSGGSVSASSAGAPACMLYAAQFSKEGGGRYIVAGGSNVNEAKVFDHHNGNSVVGTVTGLTRGVFAVDFAPDCQRVAIAGGDTAIRILDIEN